MKDNLFSKFFVTTFCILILSITVMFVILSIFISNYIGYERRVALIDNCATVAAIIDDDTVLKNDSNLVTLTRTLSNTSGADFFVTNPRGFVEFCTCDSFEKSGVCVHSENRVSDNMMINSSKENYFELTDLVGMLSERVYCSAKTVTDSDGEVYANVFAISSTKRVMVFNSTLLKMFVLSSIIPLVLLFLAEYMQIYKMRKPLKTMSEAARCVARGDFSKRIPVISNDEIGELSVSFNQMTNSLVRLEETRRSFIANVSHELKTPMTTIGGFIDGIIDGTIPPEKQGYYLHIVSDEVKRLSRIVRSMLSLSRLESGETKIKASRFYLADITLNIVIAQEQRIEGKKIDIDGLDSLKHEFVFADRDLIHQVIYNLVDNAVKFTNESGKISFSIESDLQWVIFKIRNTGEGIKQNDLPFVFDRFYKIDRSRSAVPESTGLGLHIAKTIMNVHSGEISVSSVEDEYTEFCFKLPKINTEEMNYG